MTVLPPDVTGSFGEAKKMLDYVVAAAFDAPGGPLALPTRQYVTIGQAVYDCEQVVSTMSVISTGLPASAGAVPGAINIGNCSGPWQLTVDVAVVRCHPNSADDGTPPSAQQLTDFSEIAGADVWCLMHAGMARQAEGFGNVACTISFPPPQGGMAATVGRFIVGITL